MKRSPSPLAAVASVAAAVLLLAGTAVAQVPAGPKVAVQAITQVSPNLPQYTKVDQPLLRDGIAKANASGKMAELQMKWFGFTMDVPADAVTAWIDEVLEASQRDSAIRLGDSFAERDVISGVEIFGEPMRGVWVWRKPSIMPHLYLGWARADPRTAETFDESDAVFLRRTPKSLRRRSRLEHQG